MRSVFVSEIEISVIKRNTTYQELYATILLLSVTLLINFRTLSVAMHLIWNWKSPVSRIDVCSTIFDGLFMNKGDNRSGCNE